MINYVPSFRFLVHTEGRQLRLLLFGFAIATTPGRLANTARSPATTRFARDDRVKSSACKNMEGFQKCWLVCIKDEMPKVPLAIQRLQMHVVLSLFNTLQVLLLNMLEARGSQEGNLHKGCW